MEIPVWFEATMTSEDFLKTTIGTKREGKGFEIACAQLCGLGHYRMVGYMTVHNDEGYSAWLTEQKNICLKKQMMMIGEMMTGRFVSLNILLNPYGINCIGVFF